MTYHGENRMVEIAQRYADELSAQFRTLNHFTTQSGEIGRAHETYLRGVIERFLPAKIGICTGFVASSRGVSPQQDIIIYNAHDRPLLFKVGDCVVVDEEAVTATIEVKTSIADSESLCGAFKQMITPHGRSFTGLVIWEGMTLETTLDTIWGYLRENPEVHWGRLPKAIYTRSRHLLLMNEDGKRESPPFRVLKINPDNEGQALMSLIATLWIYGIQHFVDWPWWLEQWWNTMPSATEFVPWPDGLLTLIRAGKK